MITASSDRRARSRERQPVLRGPREEVGFLCTPQRHEENPMGTKSTLIETEPLLLSAVSRRSQEDIPAIELWDAWVFAKVETDLALDT